MHAHAHMRVRMRDPHDPNKTQVQCGTQRGTRKSCKTQVGPVTAVRDSGGTSDSCKGLSESQLGLKPSLGLSTGLQRATGGPSHLYHLQGL